MKIDKSGAGILKLLLSPLLGFWRHRVWQYFYVQSVGGQKSRNRNVHPKIYTSRVSLLGNKHRRHTEWNRPQNRY